MSKVSEERTICGGFKNKRRHSLPRHLRMPSQLKTCQFGYAAVRGGVDGEALLYYILYDIFMRGGMSWVSVPFGWTMKLKKC